MNPHERKAVEWMFSGDTGSSSEAICRYMLLGTVGGYIATPCDADDFGRCHRLLERVVRFRRRIGEMAKVGGGWERLAPEWPSLTNMYVAKEWRQLGERLRELMATPKRRAK